MHVFALTPQGQAGSAVVDCPLSLATRQDVIESLVEAAAGALFGLRGNSALLTVVSDRMVVVNTFLALSEHEQEDQLEEFYTRTAEIIIGQAHS